MSIASSLKKYVPEPLRPCLRTFKRVVTGSKARQPTYEDRVRAELGFFTAAQTYGPNFNPEKVWDREFIDRVHMLDVQEIDAGRVKPTHMYAVMTQTSPRVPVMNPRFPRHWSPEFCVRHP